MIADVSEHLPYSRHCAKCLSSIIPFNPITAVVGFIINAIL